VKFPNAVYKLSC